MAAQRRGIACAGNWIIDHVYICDRWPAEETLANILEEGRGTGGAPYNCLIDIARFGPAPAAAGRWAWRRRRACRMWARRGWP